MSKYGQIYSHLSTIASFVHSDKATGPRGLWLMLAIGPRMVRLLRIWTSFDLQGTLRPECGLIWVLSDIYYVLLRHAHFGSGRLG